MLAMAIDDRAASKSARINLRASHAQESLIRRAAKLAHKSLSDFILDSACNAAVDSIADQKIFLLDDAAWGKFQEALARPAESKPALKALFS